MTLRRRFRQPESAWARQPLTVKGTLASSTGAVERTDTSALAVHRAALDGLGPALLADLLTGPDLASGQLVDLFPDHEVTARNFDTALWMLYASRAYVPHRVQAFAEFIKQVIQQE